MSELIDQKQADAIGRLSDGQLACLRLVMDGHTSKQIAKELGISPHTVDQRLRLAIQTLRVDSRFEAARLVRQSENGPYQRPVYQSPHVVEAAEPVETEPTSGDTDGARRHDAHSVVGEARPGFEPLPTPISLPSSSDKARVGGRRNELAPVVRIAWTVGLMIGVVLALGLLIAAAEGLARVLEALRT